MPLEPAADHAVRAPPQRRHATELYLFIRSGELEVLRQVLDHTTNETTTGNCIDFETMATVSPFDRIVLGQAKERPALPRSPPTTGPPLPAAFKTTC